MESGITGSKETRCGRDKNKKSTVWLLMVDLGYPTRDPPSPLRVDPNPARCQKVEFQTLEAERRWKTEMVLT
ncbi:hypothetical protein C5167_018521 [Papaver somniferum]|uniref:Uncharacterized protein n=1 Tax=Papaver somniferum TaxID=3469 RepID=A0A4Y7IQW1_PAPSO|nr:hypothetical protein C5167_018521 [Papaver somniferum]